MCFARHIHDTSPSVRCQTLAQLVHGGAWRLTLMHDRPEHLLVWTTRGQGRAVVEGIRRGVGVHNALFIPAGTLFSLDMGGQGFGQAVLIPPEAAPTLPEGPCHLRIRNSAAQVELTGLLEAMGREQSAGRSWAAEALAAGAGLVSVWLRRQIEAQDGAAEASVPGPAASQRLVRQYCRAVSAQFRAGRGMGELAEDLGVTPTHLSRVCKECSGLTAAEILTERLLYEARALLERPEPQIRDVAQHLGFSSAAYFSRFVQHHTGQPPSALRRRP